MPEGSTACQTAVIGGGAAGLAAAAAAGARGERVAVLEGASQVGRKILVSGNGRCNLTNLDGDDLSHYHGGQPRFPRPALVAFPVERTLAFFRELGIETREEKRGRLFPLSDQAQSVVDVLVDRLARQGVEVRCNTKVQSLELRPGGGFAVGAGSRSWTADRVVMASGGVSVAKLGADASGMDLAASLGHTRTPLLPGLVPLESPDATVHRMQGVRVWAEIAARPAGGPAAVETDDLLFTKYGVSGFAVLSLSAKLVPALAAGPQQLHVNLFPGRTAEELSELLKHRWARNPHRSLSLSFAGLLHSRVVGPFVQRLGLSPDRPVERLTRAERWQLAQELTDWRIPVTAPHSFDHAEVTIGGIRTSEIDPGTLESYLVPGLYFAGEMVDVHGDLGGYNLQWAWSSGYLAGQRLGS